MSVTALLLCAGKGERLGFSAGKPLAPLAGRPLFAWSLQALQRARAVEGIVIVGPVKALQEGLAGCDVAAAKVVGWSEGGAERQDSVSRGLRALPPGCAWVLVHDCARPLVTAELVDRVVADARLHGAAIAGIRLADTLKRASLDSVEATVPRAALWLAQTPQVFRRDWLEEAHHGASRHATDDAALVEALGRQVHLTEGDSLNLKVTTPRDLELAEAWLTRVPART